MTKKLLDTLETLSSHNKSGIMLTVVKNFLEEHICVAKGEHRHPYADILHAWIEGEDIEVSNDGKKWSLKANISESYKFDYRIYNPEPVYEYQWKFWKKGRDEYEITPFKTEAEVKRYLSGTKYDRLEKDESTKREIK
jgi:hypothetical protein